jgi:hypothetical protein
MSLGDLSSLGRSILRSSILPPALSRWWLKPSSLVGSVYGATGHPWEIYRMDAPVAQGSNRTRVVDLYTKNGGIGAYSSWLLLSPDHKIGISVLTASANGDRVSVSVLAELAVNSWIPAAEAASRENAAANFAGTFKPADGSNSSFTLSVLPDRSLVRLESFVFNGTQYLTLFSAVLGINALDLQYMGLAENGELSFRAIAQYPVNSLLGNTALLKSCVTNWGGIDSPRYGNLGLDEWLIDVDSNGKATAVSFPAMRTGKWLRV